MMGCMIGNGTTAAAGWRDANEGEAAVEQPSGAGNGDGDVVDEVAYPDILPITLIQNHNALSPRHTNHSIRSRRQSVQSSRDYRAMRRRNR